jgi:hypothetical protein
VQVEFEWSSVDKALPIPDKAAKLKDLVSSCAAGQVEKDSCWQQPQIMHALS